MSVSGSRSRSPSSYECHALSALSDVLRSGSGSVLTMHMRSSSSVSSLAIQKPSPSKSGATTAFTEPTGLFSGFGVELDVCAACGVLVFLFLSFFGDLHSLSQCPGLPQLWHLPLQHFLPPSMLVAAKASSGESFFPPWLFCPLHARFSADLPLHRSD